MKLTVDASVVVKWFLTEPQSDEARRLLTPRFHLHAPDILLAEYANTIWKKVHRNEIPNPQPYFDEVANLSEVVTLERGSNLIERAARIAVEIDHPVYDCLYLACAQVVGSVLITADRQFAKKATGRGVEVWCIGAPGAADRVEAAATAPIISEDIVDALVDAYELFAATERHVVEALRNRRRSGAEGLTALTMADMDLYLDSPAYKRLVGLVNDLAVEERVDLLALGWLGAGLLDGSWQRNLDHASEVVGMDDNHYAAGYGQYWRAGYARLKNEMQARRRPTPETEATSTGRVRPIP